MADSTSGTFTFLLSDIEGSTQLARRLGDGWGGVLADHHRLLRAAFEESGGEGIGTQGDAFFVAFRRAKDAVLAALAAQRSLAAHEWPRGVELRVRMGIHTGEAAVSNGEYHGLAIHRAARICSACNGGEILLSHATSTLLDDEEHEGSPFAILDLGEQRLKDFERPVRVYQLVPTDGDGLAQTGGAGGVIRVLIVDDQALVRAGFRMILDAQESIEVVGEASDGEEAIVEADRLRPHVVLMDVRMPTLDGIEATRLLLGREGSETKVVMLTTFDMDEYLYEALRAGASGFLLKDVPPEQLVAGIHAVASGEALLAPAVTRRVIEEFVRLPRDTPPAPPPAALDDLTPRELEVLRLIARGLSNAEIADELVVSQATIKTHVARLLTKLELRDRVQAVVLAYESGLVVAGNG
ncbi:MAG TPA: response regulator [Gaiellaceae bacterium]|jgi:DNA-binding NarL/FixJ family response regulator/class 3 adenylate cyclase|nr:response regulator [Gaiellaceae bacterium]